MPVRLGIPVPLQYPMPECWYRGTGGISRRTRSRPGQRAGVKGRVSWCRLPERNQVLIDYAHTPDGLENVLSLCQGLLQGRLIAVFGCGGDRTP